MPLLHPFEESTFPPVTCTHQGREGPVRRVGGTAWRKLNRKAVHCPGCSHLQSPALTCRQCKADLQKVRSPLHGLQFYQIRHTAITAAAEQHVPLSVTRALAGHMDEAMTAYYTNARDAAKVQAVEAIANANPELLQVLGPTVHGNQ